MPLLWLRLLPAPISLARSGIFNFGPATLELLETSTPKPTFAPSPSALNSAHKHRTRNHAAQEGKQEDGAGAGTIPSKRATRFARTIHRARRGTGCGGERDRFVCPPPLLDDCFPFVEPVPDYSHAGIVSKVRTLAQKKKSTKKTALATLREEEAAVFGAAGAIEKILHPGTCRGDYVRTLTSDERAAVILGLAEQKDDLVEEVGELKKQLAESRRKERPNLRRDFGLAAIQAAYEEKKRMGLLPEQQQEVRLLPLLLLPQSLTHAKEKGEKEDVEVEVEAAPVAQQPRSAPSTPPSTFSAAQELVRQQQPPATAPHPSMLSRVFSTMGGYFGSPFARKRPAEAAAEEPSQKRVRTEQVTLEESPRHQEDSPREEQLALPAPPQPSPPNTGLHMKRTAESHDDDDEIRPAKRARGPEPQETPPSVRQQRDSARDFVGPSSKNPKVPTSLSTITEYTEPSSAVIDAPDTTPSKPSRAASSHHLKAPQNTPATAKRSFDSTQDLDAPDSTTPTAPQSAFSASSTSIYQSTPTHQPNMMRRSAQLRAARIAQQNTPTTSRPYAWERNTATPKPREPNADARLAKIQRIRDLERQLNELKEDVEVQQIESHSIHRRKRVKIDDLASIPHNRPGDSVGTFRVPEPDSDDEIEVEDSMDVDSNIFEEGEKSAVPTTKPAQVTASLSSPQVTTPTPVQSTTAGISAVAPRAPPKTPGFSFPSVTSSKPATATPAAAPAANFPNATQKPQANTQIPVAPASEKVYNFPNVGPKPKNYYVSPEYQAEAGRLFTEGFNKWLVENGHA